MSEPVLINLQDYEVAARAKMDRMALDYYAAGAEDQVTLRENRNAYERLRLRYRVLVDVSKRSTATTLLGQSTDMPVLVAPTAFHKLAHDEGEVATARAAKAAGTIMVLSTISNCTIEDVAAAAGPLWFQLYVYRDREATLGLVRRAERAGCQALVLTVDAPVWGRREPDIRNNFQLPDRLSITNLTGDTQQKLPRETSGSNLAKYIAEQFDASLNWQDVAWLRSNTKLPLLIKGIVRPDDALRAVDAGVAGVVVSNHGGRQLDGAPATIEVLEEIAQAIDGRCAVLIDGGVRRGTDVIKALALGADAVLVGRPILWGLAVGGEAGARHVLELLAHELDVAMALCGCASTERITRDLVHRGTLGA